MAFPTSPANGQSFTTAGGATFVYDSSVGVWKKSAGVGSIAAGSITTAELADGTVVAVDLATGAVTSPKLAAGAVDTSALGTASVTSAKLAAGAVDTAALATGAVTSAKLAAGAVTSIELGTMGDLTAAQLQALATDLAADTTAAATLGLGGSGGAGTTSTGTSGGSGAVLTKNFAGFTAGVVLLGSGANASVFDAAISGVIEVSRNNTTFYTVGSASVPGGSCVGFQGVGVSATIYVVGNVLNGATTMVSDGSGTLYTRSVISTAAGPVGHSFSAVKAF